VILEVVMKEDKELSGEPGKEVICAITAALGLYLEEPAAEVIQPPPYIILPPSLAPAPSPWRFVGRQAAMESRTLVSMKCMRW